MLMPSIPKKSCKIHVLQDFFRFHRPEAYRRSVVESGSCRISGCNVSAALIHFTLFAQRCPQKDLFLAHSFPWVFTTFVPLIAKTAWTSGAKRNVPPLWRMKKPLAWLPRAKRGMGKREFILNMLCRMSSSSLFPQGHHFRPGPGRFGVFFPKRFGG